MAAASLSAEFCADGVADHGEGNPGADEKAVAAHEAAAVVDVEEGAPEFIDGSAFFAEAVAGGQVEHPDADDGEEEQAGDPDVAGDVVLLHLGDDEAADHGDQECDDGAQWFGRGGVGIGMGE